MACDWLFDYPDDLKHAIMDNYLVNPSGIPARYYEGDLLQEHHNREIKRTFNPKNGKFDSPWMRTVSLNIRPLGSLRRGLYEAFGLKQVTHGRSKAQLAADIEKLASRHLADNIHVFHEGRSQPHVVANGYTTGYNKLAGGQLHTFLHRASVVATLDE
jgi:hypothetical protein